LGAHALGSSKPRVILFVLLPAALPGLVSAVLLGMGRALAETAALLFTSGYSTRMPESVLDPGRVLSIHIYDLAMNIPGGESRAAAAALLIMGLFLMISSAAIFVSVVYGKKIGASK
jgi:phosphate transport system permease protein